MTTAAELQLQNQIFGDLKKNWGWMMALGVVMVFLGMIGMGMAGAMTLVSVLYFGILLLLGSGVQLAQAFRAEGWKGRVWQILIALLYLAAGVVVIRDPVMASVTLTLVLAWSIIAIGIVRIIMSLQLRGTDGWVWVLVAGIAAIILGVMILNRWPMDSLWIIGLLVSIDLVFAGWSQIVIALAARKLPEVDQAQEPQVVPAVAQGKDVGIGS